MSALFALLASLAWGASDFLGGTASRRIPALAVVGASQAIALVVIVVAALLTGGFSAPLGYLPWALAAGVVGLGALLAFYAALAKGTMGVVAPIAATSVVIPIAVGLASGEAPSPWQLLGIGVACVGVVLASGPELRGGGRGGRLPLLLAGTAAVGFGIVVVLIAHGSRHNVVMTLLTMRAVSVAVVASVALKLRTDGGVRKSDVPLLTAIGLGDAGANALYGFAIRSGMLSVVSVLASLYPAVTVVLARYFHGERMRRIQDVGVVAALAGVVLIAAGG